MGTNTNIDDNAKSLIYKDTNGEIHDEEKYFEIKSEKGFDIELISAAVSTNDNPDLPCLTFRYWVLSTEHVCIGVAVAAGGFSAYAVDIISIQELFYNTRVSFFVGFMLLISTQMIGYGLAGFVRK
ncbi:14128_t:CDS:2, partial [Dentiscutata erythropus]